MVQSDPRLTVVGGLVIVWLIILVALQLLPAGPRQIGPIEAVTGIPFPSHDGTIVVTENLAHADVRLRESVFGKTLLVSLTFTPHNVQKLGVGVRENDFWLSYTPIVFYETNSPEAVTHQQTATIRIPLTDKLQDRDRSIDLILFAQQADLPLVSHIADPMLHTTYWELHQLETSTHWQRPSLADSKEYVRSLVERERPL